MKALITYIIPVYNTPEEYLVCCIESLLHQDKAGFEVIIVDDGSTDNCGKICERYAEKHDVIRVIHKKNEGVSAARNAGMKEVRTEWTAFVDPDDWVSPDMFSAISEAIKDADTQADIIMFGYSEEYVNLSENRFLDPLYEIDSEEFLSSCRKAPFFKLMYKDKVVLYSIASVLNKVYRTDFLRANELCFLRELKKGQDRIFNAQAFTYAEKIQYVDRILYHYRCHKASVTNAFNEDIVRLTFMEIDELRKIIKNRKPDAETEIMLNCRICTRLYSCMRLFYFNKLTDLFKRKNILEIKRLAESDPYQKALKDAEMRYFSFPEKIFVIMLKLKLYRICAAVSMIRSYMLNIKLN